MEASSGGPGRATMPAMRSGPLRLAIALLGTALGAIAQAIQLEAGATPERALIAFVVGEAYLLGGLFAGGRDPDNRTWWLMTGAGVGWFIGDLAGSSSPALRAVGIALADTDAILLIALVLAYPTGRLDGVLHRATVALAAIGLTLANVAALVTGDATASLVLGLGLTVAMAILVPLRWLRAARGERRLLAPAVMATGITLAAIGVAIVIRLADVGERLEGVLLAARDVGVLAIPVGFVFGSFLLAQDELRRSRARIVDAGAAERRRLERDLHDGAQQRLVGLALSLRLLSTKLGDAEPAVTIALEAAREDLRSAIGELRELARGIHPAALTAGGLGAALPALVERSPIPTSIVAVPEERFPDAVEVTTYFLVSEALANVGKHAHATSAWVRAETEGGDLVVEVADDGVGGATEAAALLDGRRAEPAGTGLLGMQDRVLAVGGELVIEARQGGGTIVRARIPRSAPEPAVENPG
jgi:signal transduction histidine kinase